MSTKFDKAWSGLKSNAAADGVTRRQFLAWMGVGATAVASGPLLAACSASTDSVGFAPQTEPETKSLQFSFPQLPSHVTGLILGVQGTHYPLQQHTVATRQALAQAHPLGSQIDTSKLTHYVDNVQMPTDGPVEFVVWGNDAKAAKAGAPVSKPVTWSQPDGLVGVPASTNVFGQVPGEVYVAGGINVPTWALKNVLLAAQQVKPLNEAYANDARLTAWGIKNAPNDIDQIASLFDLYDTPTSIAAKIVFKTPGVTNMSSQGSAIALSIINSSNELTGLANAVNTMLTNMGVYGVTEPQMQDPTGTPVYISTTGNAGTGPQALVFNPFIQDGTKYLGTPIPPAWTTALRSAIQQAGQSVSNQCMDAAALEQTQQSISQGDGGNWVVSNGATPQVIDADTAHSKANDLAATQVGDSPMVTWTLTPDGYHQNFKAELNGTPSPIDPTTPTATPSGSPSPSPSPTGGGTSIPIRIYNNNEKFAGIYQQCFSGNTQISLGDGNYSPTDYTAQIGSMTTIMTILGVPLFDTNWSDVNVLLPATATSARVLMCTFGSGTGWMPYFMDPTGNQLYGSNNMPPQCSGPAIWTSIMNLAVPFVMMAADSGGLGAVEKVGATDFGENGPTITSVLTATLKVFGASAVFQTIVNGLLCQQNLGAVTNWGSTSPAQFLVPLGKMLMTLLVKGVAKVLAALLAAETASKVADAIPLVGEVFAAISIAADVAAWATSLAQVTSLPPVTPFSVSGAYTSTLTINKDPRNSVFPRTATKWTLTPQIKGDSALTAVQSTTFSWQDTGSSFTQAVPSIPVGSLIRWQIVFQDQNGWKVGVGATDWLDNADITNLPNPTITITELQPPLDGKTTFDLNATTEWQASGSGSFIWSDQTSIAGTIQDQTTVTGKTALPAAGTLAVGTVTGRVGYVYQTENGWRVNQVASTQNPNSGAANTGKFYTQQPHLVYDGVGSALTGGSNFLLEPWPKINGYLVRQIDLSQDDFGIKPVGSGSITAHGRFYGELHGAAFHPAGFIVAYNSSTGRLQTLYLPKNPVSLDSSPSDGQINSVPTATFFSGTGNLDGSRPGLVQQPVGVGMGLNGIVLVLEQGAQRVQAFNSAGSPTPYFFAGSGSQSPTGTPSPSGYTPPPNSAGYYLDLSQTIPNTTYLGIGVDGAGFVYVHGYQGDGSQVSQYGVSIYDKAGNNVVPFANGINGAAFAVDYWRDLYTQAFIPVQTTTGAPYINAQSGVAQPAMSIWIPDTPNPTASPTSS